MNELALFAGAGGGILGGKLLGWNTTPLAYYVQDKMMGTYRPSQFGTTFVPLTETHGEGLLTWYREDFLAKTSAPQTTTEKDLQGNGRDSGMKCSESFARLDPDGCWLKTQPTCEQRDLMLSSKDWPKQGMMLRGECFPLEMPEQITNANECGLLPTPTTCGNQLTPSMMKHKGCRNPQRFLKQLPTPTAHNAKEGGYPAEGTRNTPTLGWEVGGKIPPILTEWMMGWPIGWTDLKPLETDKYQSWQQQHGVF